MHLVSTGCKDRNHEAPLQEFVKYGMRVVHTCPACKTTKVVNGQHFSETIRRLHGVTATPRA